MTTATRSNVVSSFTAIKGPMIPETYAVFRSWDLQRTKKQNLDRVRDENPLGSASQTWVRDVAKVLNRRYEPSGRDLALVILAQGDFPLEEWKPILLWHMTRDEFLLRDFLVNWLYPEFEDGTFRLHAEDLYDFLGTLPQRGGAVEHPWSSTTLDRTAASLLTTAVDFGLLKGSKHKEFASYHLPESSFLYLLHALRDEAMSPQKVIASPEWRMYLLAPQDVERELLRLHQYRKIHYDAAGSLIQLTLPYDSALDYAKAIA